MKPLAQRRQVKTFLEKVYRTLTKYEMVARGDRIIAGVSGGPDSMAMLYTLFLLQERWEGSLVVAHFNHRLRGEESDAEAIFVQQTAHRLHLPYVDTQQDISVYAKKHHLSLQTAARELRYQFFQEILLQQQAQKIAVAHTACDQAETLLITLLQGTARSGLRGILPQREDRVIRPLLEVTREEIEDFLAEAEIAYVLDPSNTKLVYLRNRVRHHLLPFLQKHYHPQVPARLQRLATLLQEEEMWLAQETTRAYGQALRTATAHRLTFDLAALQSLVPALLRRVLRQGAQQIGGGRLTAFHLMRIASLVTTGKEGQALHLPGQMTVRRNAHTLSLLKAEAVDEPLPIPQKLRVPGETLLPWCNLTLHTQLRHREKGEAIAFVPDQELLDYRQTGNKLWVRTWQEGDRFTPLGMRQSKRLSRFFIDEKIPRSLRKRIPLLTTAPQGGEVLSVIGKRIADRVKITPETREILLITSSANAEKGSAAKGSEWT